VVVVAIEGKVEVFVLTMLQRWSNCYCCQVEELSVVALDVEAVLDLVKKNLMKKVTVMVMVTG